MLLVFDWDGTLVDSAAAITEAMDHAIQNLGFERKSDMAIRNIIGLGLPEAIKILMPELSSAESELLRQEYAKIFVQLDTLNPSTLFPLVKETLDELKEEGHLLAVATGKSRRGLDRIMQALKMESYFHASRCADETLSKPNPLMLAQILEQLKQSVDNTMMIGDSEYDLAMAQNIGMPSIGVTYGVHSKPQLQKYHPLACIDCISELSSLVLRQDIVQPEH